MQVWDRLNLILKLCTSQAWIYTGHNFWPTTCFVLNKFYTRWYPGIFFLYSVYIVFHADVNTWNGSRECTYILPFLNVAKITTVVGQVLDCDSLLEWCLMMHFQLTLNIRTSDRHMLIRFPNVILSDKLQKCRECLSLLFI